MDLFIGLMSGTSLDSMDGVLVDFSKKPPNILAAASISYPGSLKKNCTEFNYLSKEHNFSLADLGRLEQDVAVLAAQVTRDLIKQAGIYSSIQAIGFAGQTIAHNPSARYTMQCGDPNILAEMTRIPVVADIRRRDLAAGGQGAPLTAAFHQYLFANNKESRCILNLGGIANITILCDNQPLSGFDTGPANCLLDDWTHENLQKNYDDKGSWAASGSVIDDLLTLFLEDEYFSKAPPKTTGRDYFNINWIKDYLNRLSSSQQPKDVQATLVDLIALSISLAIHQRIDNNESSDIKLYLAGGGANNDYLVKRIKSLSKLSTYKTDELGINSKQLEAVAFAWLAKMRIMNQAGNIPAVTGAAGSRVLGGLYHP